MKRHTDKSLMSHGRPDTIKPGFLICMPGSHKCSGSYLFCIEAKADIPWTILAVWNSPWDGLWREAILISKVSSLNFFYRQHGSYCKCTVYTHWLPNPSWYCGLELVSFSSFIIRFHPGTYFVRIVFPRVEGGNSSIFLGFCPVEYLLIFRRIL